MSRPIRLLTLINTLEVGGTEMRLVELARRLPRDRYETHVACMVGAGAYEPRLRKANVPIHEYAPAQVKNAVAGTGRADKKQVRMMVETLLGQRLDQPDDATDALAVAICHLHAAPLAARIGGGAR